MMEMTEKESHCHRGQRDEERGVGGRKRERGEEGVSEIVVQHETLLC